MTIQIEDEPLAARLRAIEIATPEFRERASTRRKTPVILRAKARRRGGMMLALALVVLGIAATYPAIGQEALSWVGLRPSQVEPLTGSASYNGGSMTVAGGYADDINTVLFIAFDRIDCTPYLTDQFGERYDIEGGLGEDVGAFPAIFDPLRGKAAASGSSITVHCPVGPHDVAIHLTGALLPHSTHDIEPPGKVVLDGTTYEIAGLRWSGTYLEVHTRIYGKLIDKLMADVDAITPGPGKPTPSPTFSGVTFPGVFLIAGSGSAEIPVAVMNGRDVEKQLDTHHVLDEVRVFRANHAGTYRIVVTRGEPNSTPTVSWTVTVR